MKKPIDIIAAFAGRFAPATRFPPAPPARVRKSILSTLTRDEPFIHE